MPDLGHMLPHSLLQMQYATALLLRIAGDLKLEPDTLFLFTMLLKEGKREMCGAVNKTAELHAC